MSYIKQGERMQVKRLLIKDTGTYEEQYRRPYTAEFTGHTASVFQEKLAGVSKYTPSALSGIAEYFVHPTADFESKVLIPNGWGEKRMRFIMEIEHTWNMGATVSMVVLGYTTHVGVTHAGNIDMNMEFYVNSILELKYANRHTPLGNQVIAQVNDSSHVFANNDWNDIYTSQKDNTMRPSDIFTLMDRTQCGSLGDNCFDARIAVTRNAIKSKRSNCLPSNYAAGILQSYNAANLTSGQMGAAEASVLESARGYAGESLASQDPFLVAVAHIREAGIGNVFTFQDLLRLDPNIARPEVTQVRFNVPTQRMQPHHTGQTQHWGGTDTETLVATSLTQSVPGLLMETALAFIWFKATNYTLTNAAEIIPIDVKQFGSGDNTAPIDSFFYRLENEVLRGISKNNQMSYMLEMRVDLLGETWVSIAVNGGPSVDYVTPSFADALLVPVITSNDQHAVGVASNFDTLIHHLQDDCNGISEATGMPSNIFGSI